MNVIPVFPLEDVPLDEAVLLIDADTDKALVMYHYDECPGGYSGLILALETEDEDRALYRLIWGAWTAVLHGMDPETLHREMCRIPEYKRAFDEEHLSGTEA